MTNFSPFRPSRETRLSNTIVRKIIMQKKILRREVLKVFFMLGVMKTDLMVGVTKDVGKLQLIRVVFGLRERD